MVRADRQGPPRRAGNPAADRVRAPPLRRGGAGPGRAGAQRGPAGLRPVRPARHGRRRAGVPGGQPHPAGHPAAGGTRARGAGLAPPQPGQRYQHAAQPGLRWHLRLWPQHPGPQAAAGRAAVHRPGPPAARAVGGVPARDAAGLYQHRAVRAEHAATGRQPVPRPEPGRGARRPGPAGRAGGLRPVRQEDDGPLPARARREAAPGLRLRPRQVRLRR